MILSCKERQRPPELPGQNCGQFDCIRQRGARISFHEKPINYIFFAYFDGKSFALQALARNLNSDQVSGVADLSGYPWHSLNARANPRRKLSTRMSYAEAILRPSSRSKRLPHELDSPPDSARRLHRAGPARRCRERAQPAGSRSWPS